MPAKPPVDTPQPSSEQTSPDPRKRRATIACASCGGLFALALVIAIVSLSAWEAKDSRQYKGKPLPRNVAYIGYWVGDGTLSARIDTFAITGDRIACDFAIRNDTKQDVTVRAIGRTIVGVPMDSLLATASELPLELIQGDRPMAVTDDENVMGIQKNFLGQWLLFLPAGDADTPQPQPFTLKPGEVKRFRYRPRAYPELLPASALRIAIQTDDGSPPHAFYFLRKSAGIGGLFERGAQKALQEGRGAR